MKEVQEQEPNTDTEDEKDQTFLVCTIKVSEVKSNHEWMDKLVLNGVCPIQFKIDTGSQVNIISINVLKRLHDKTIPILNTKLILETKKRNLKFVVIRENCTPILGLQSSTDLKIVRKVNVVLGMDANKESFLNNNKIQYRVRQVTYLGNVFHFFA